jgi:N-acetylglucosamine-6-phosphate deacetylase
LERATVDAAGAYLAPGFVDVHVHGGAGADFMDATPAAFATAIAAHLRHGTTSIVPTNTVGRHDRILAFLDLARRFKADGPRPERGLGRVVGCHLYGPYFAEEKIGLPPAGRPAADRGRVPAVPRVRRLHAAGHVRAGAARVGRLLPGARAAGVRLNAGHSNATWAEMQAAFDLGVRHVDHFFCAMSNYVSTRSRVGTPMQGGMMEFVLATDAMTTELIADGRHLSPELLRFTLKMLGAGRVAL